MLNAHRYFPDVQGGVQLLKFTDSLGNFSRKAATYIAVYSTSSLSSYLNLDNQRADMVFFCLFPMLFLVFNLIYWWSVIQWREETWNTFRSVLLFFIVFIFAIVFLFLFVWEFAVIFYLNISTDVRSELQWRGSYLHIQKALSLFSIPPDPSSIYVPQAP